MHLPKLDWKWDTNNYLICSNDSLNSANLPVFYHLILYRLKKKDYEVQKIR